MLINTGKFFKDNTIARARRVSAILLVFEKIYLCFFIPSYTQNHVITYTNSIIFFFLTHVLVKLLTRVSHFSFHSDFYSFDGFEKV